MSNIIRFVGETDAEYQRRIRPEMPGLSKALYARQIKQLLDNNNAITRFWKLAELRASCGIREKGTFKWTVYHDGKA